MPAALRSALRPESRRPRPAPALTIHDLLSYRLGVVSGLLSRSAALRYRREFDVSLWEWRAIALLGADGPLSLNALAKGAALDKSQMSRVVSALTERGLVLRELDASDARGVQLTLTSRGRRVYAGLIRAAGERDAALRAALSAAERACLERALQTLNERARELWHGERAHAATARTSPRRRAGSPLR
jgi:DNA-binding MarR family transcriptional regulator